MYSARSFFQTRALARLGLVLAAVPSCASERLPALRHAEPVSSVDLADCLDAAQFGSRPDEARCPEFLTESLRAARETCGEVGGSLRHAAQSTLWSVDVDGDGQLEFLFELDTSVECDGAWSVFSCGSLGCPKVLYRKSGTTWSAIGNIDADEPGTVEVLASPDGKGPGELRVSCAYEDPCSEFAYYEWKGQSYELSRLEVRGFTVDVAGSLRGLGNLTRAIEVRATPTTDGAILDHYGADTEVVIRGQAEGRPWYYVSPCNACRSGFIEKSAVRA